MAFLGSLVAFLSSSTAKSMSKFIYGRLEAFINSKTMNLPAPDKAKLKSQSDELKTINNNIQNMPQNETVTERDIENLKKKIVEIEDFQKKKKLSEVLISPELFENWIENEAIEDRALIAHKRLDVLVDWCLKNKIKETKRWQIENVSNNLAMFTSNLRKARETLQANETYIPYRQSVMEAEIALRSNLSAAKAIFAEYKNYGC
jgi:hypothetical protein